MSYFDDASLVMIPSGYKASKVYSVKPTDGTGDLTFTRSNDTATRVGPDGLIEKVRTNLVLQSNTFSDAAWTKSNTTVTSGQSGYDGTSNAWLLTDDATSGAHSVVQFSRWASSLQTGSVYVKAGTNIKAYIGNASTGRGAFFNLSTGTVEGVIGTVVGQSIVSVGSGWYRISVTLQSAGTLTIGLYQTFVGGNFNSTVNYSGSGSTIVVQAAQLEAGDIATEPILTTAAAVSVGPVANVPRLDYLGSSCPRLLLEPQRTNSALYSEQFDNAAWTKSNTTITANAVTSPSGYQDADKLIANTTSASHLIQRTFTPLSATSYTLSTYAKAGEYNFIGLQIAFGGINAYASYNLSTGVVFLSGGGATATIQNAGNGWYRCFITATTISTTPSVFNVRIENDGSLNNFVGNNVNGIYAWGCQLEAGAYATSYIPTLGAAVTRGADAAFKTSASALIGQTEGVVFMDFIAQTSTAAQSHFFLGNDKIGLYGGSTFTFYSDGGVSINGGSFVTGQRYKIAFAYKANDYVAYVNGVQKGTDTSATVPATSELYVNSFNGSLQIQKKELSQFLLFTTRLTNAQLAELTTI